MTVQHNIGGVWKAMDTCKVNIGGVWKEVAKSWVNINGVWKVEIEAFTPAIGMSYGGGIIFYIDGTGQHGLIAATSDQSTGIAWAVAAYQSTTVPAPGAIGTAIGTGLANTNAIVAQNGVGITYAAGLCDAYTNTDTDTGIYSDWYLPSKDELNQLYLNKDAVGVFASAYYWSSTEYGNFYAWMQNFISGPQNDGGKANTYHVRAVRAF